MSENALATLSDLTSLPATAKPLDLSKYATGKGGFLPRIQLVTKGKYVDKGKIQPGHYGVPQADEEILDLGKAVDILPLAARIKALDTTPETPIAVYDENDEVFKDIQERSGKSDSGCMWGPSILILERKTGKLYEWFLGNKSAREEAPQLTPFLPISQSQAKDFGVKPKPATPCTLSSRLIERPRYSWHVPVITKCSTPFDKLPDLEYLKAEVEKFVNPKKEAPEMASADNNSRSV